MAEDRRPFRLLVFYRGQFLKGRMVRSERCHRSGKETEDTSLIKKDLGVVTPNEFQLPDLGSAIDRTRDQVPLPGKDPTPPQRPRKQSPQNRIHCSLLA